MIEVFTGYSVVCEKGKMCIVGKMLCFYFYRAKDLAQSHLSSYYLLLLPNSALVFNSWEKLHFYSLLSTSYFLPASLPLQPSSCFPSTTFLLGCGNKF